MFYNPAFDEANYYQGNKFQLGGNDRSFALDHPMGKKRPILVRNDDEIQEEAWRALIRNHRIGLAGIDLAVSKGILRLTGMVVRISEKQEAERILLLIPGVVELINDLKVRVTQTYCSQGGPHGKDGPAQI